MRNLEIQFSNTDATSSPTECVDDKRPLTPDSGEIRRCMTPDSPRIGGWGALPVKLLTGTSLALIALTVALPSTAGQDGGVSRQAGDLLAQRCLSCHDAVKRAGGIDLTARAAAQSSGAFAAGADGSARLV